MNNGVSRFLKFGVVAMSLSMPTLAFAQEIELMSEDGEMVISGTLVEFKDNFYVVRSLFGDVRVNGNRVQCFGGACPPATQAKWNVTQWTTSPATEATK